MSGMVIGMGAEDYLVTMKISFMVFPPQQTYGGVQVL